MTHENLQWPLMANNVTRKDLDAAIKLLEQVIDKTINLSVELDNRLPLIQGDVNQMEQNAGAFQMFQKAVSQSGTFVCPLDNTRNISHDKRFVITVCYNSQIRYQCCKRIIGNFRFCS